MIETFASLSFEFFFRDLFPRRKKNRNVFIADQFIISYLKLFENFLILISGFFYIEHRRL